MNAVANPNNLTTGQGAKSGQKILIVGDSLSAAVRSALPEAAALALALAREIANLDSRS